MLNRLGLLVLTLFLTSCATMKQPSTPATATNLSWQEREAALNQLDSWQIAGKIAVQSPNDSGTASVNWLQNQNDYTLSFFGPLGSQNVTLKGQPGLVTLETADGKRESANSPEALLKKRLGFNIPVSHLRYWIRGLPAPGATSATQFDNAKRLSELVQQGFRVRFLSYTQAGKFDLPSKIFINSTDLNVRIIIYNWKVNKV